MANATLHSTREPTSEPTRGPTRGRIALAAFAALLLYALATPWVLRPWFLSQDDLPRSELALGPMEDTDLLLNVWILTWVARAAVEAPGEMFGGNIFHPAPNAIAGSENMLAHLPATAPAWALTGSALVVLKAMLLESFVLSGLAMSAYVWFATRSYAAALVAGAAFTFVPWRVQNVPHPQYLGFQYLPLALLAIELWLARRRRWQLLLLAAALALQALACLYLGYFTFLVVPAYALVRWLQEDRTPRGALALGAAFVLGALAAVPVGLPYLIARAQGMIPDYEVGAWGDWSWRPWWYVGAPFVHRVGPVVLAVVALDLAARVVARLRGVRVASWRSEAALWAMAATAAVLSAGPEPALPDGTPLPTPYGLLMRLVPGFAALRGPGRFFMMVAAALAALAGFAFARWLRGRAVALRAGGALVLVVACVLGAAPHPAPTMPARLGDAAPEVYRWLAAQPGDGAVLELPAAATDHDVVGNLRNARYMLASTLHWRPLLNGVTGHNPPIARFYNALTRRLPREDAVDLLRRVADVDWVVLHRDALLDHERAAWGEVEAAGLEAVARFGDVEVFAVRRSSEPAWRERLVEQMRWSSDETLDGLPRTRLPAECRAARILDVETPPVLAMAPLALPIPVRFANDSSCPWPTIAVRPAGLVGLTYAWTDPTGTPYTYPPAPFSPLIRTVAPGETVDDTLVLVPPSGPEGRWRLDVCLTQWGEPPPLAQKTVFVETRAFKAASPGADPLPHVE